MKTIRQIADEIGVSKQAVFKKIKREPLSTSLQGLTATVDGRLMVEVDGEKLIKQAFSEIAPSTTDNQLTGAVDGLVDAPSTKNAEKTAEVDGVISVLQATIDTLQGQLEVKDRQSEQQRSNERHARELADLRAQVERLQSSNAALQREISGRIGALTDRVGQETVQEVSRALQGQADAIQRKTNEFEQQANRLEEVMESQAQRVEKSQERFFAFNTWQTRIFWGGWVCNIFTLILLIFVALTK